MGPKEAGSVVEPPVLQDAGIDAAPEVWSLSQAPHPTLPLQPLESLRRHPGQVRPCSFASSGSVVVWHTLVVLWRQLQILCICHQEQLIPEDVADPFEFGPVCMLLQSMSFCCNFKASSHATAQP